MCFCMRVSRSHCSALGLQKQGFGLRSIAENNLEQIWDYVGSSAIFDTFDGFGINFDDFWCLEDSLEIRRFLIVARGRAKIEASWLVGGKLPCPWSPFHQPSS